MKLEETYRLLHARLRGLASRRGSNDPDGCAGEAMRRFLARYCEEPNDLSNVLEAAEEHLGALTLILRNVVFEHYRSGQRQVSNDVALNLATDGKETALERLLSDEQMHCVQSCIQELPSRQRTVILLRRRGLSYKTIAQELGVKVSDITNWLNRAIAHLRVCVNSCCHGVGAA